MKSIADVVSNSGLHGYAEAALVIFFLVFVAIALRVLFSSNPDLDRAARLPLDDDAHSPASEEGATR